ncbi:MAG: hypothetical protein HFI99_09705 [Lachnospiraceae bacterium]|jgi:hypothetical protein|nr:hypothetical protein [Lachnospiraceae bacterium]MCI9327023.1 hypothetical protein [Lachnospiraceae bacterium]
MDKAAFILSNIYHLHSLAGRILDEGESLWLSPLKASGNRTRCFQAGSCPGF